MEDRVNFGESGGLGYRRYAKLRWIINIVLVLGLDGVFIVMLYSIYTYLNIFCMYQICFNIF